MATYEVSTWAELVAKLSATTMESRTIKLIADIDCNDAIPTGVGSTIPIYNSGDYPVVIDGSYTENDVVKNHVIRNLRTNLTSPVAIFNLIRYTGQSSGNRNTNVTFKNINFINLILDGAPFVGTVDTGVISNNKLTFNKCSFVGRRNRFLINACDFGSTDGNALTFTSCFFNIPYKPSDTSNTYVPLNGEWKYSGSQFAYANYCRFKEYYNGWTIGAFMPGIEVSPHCSTHNLKLNGCYIDGTIVGTSSAIGITNFYTYNSTIQNVVDADLRSLSGVSGSAVSIYAPKGVYKTAADGTTNVVKKYGDDTVNCPITNQNTNAIPEIPDNMTNPAQLSADGFDIVVPN
jgi:hypothetical protein